MLALEANTVPLGFLHGRGGAERVKTNSRRGPCPWLFRWIDIKVDPPFFGMRNSTNRRHAGGSICNIVRGLTALC